MRPWQKRVADGWYSRLVAADPAPMMELQRNEEFVRGIGDVDFRAGIPSLPKVCDLPNSLRMERPYFVIFPGASWSGRQWPPEKFAKLIDEICARTGWLAVLCGSRTDYQLSVDIAALSGYDAINLAGQSSLSELVEIIRRAELLVSNETSAIHISAAVGTFSICILGGGHFGRFLPYRYEKAGSGVPPVPAFHTMDCFGCKWQCTQQYEPEHAVPCIAKVEVAQVLEIVKVHLENENTEINPLHPS